MTSERTEKMQLLMRELERSIEQALLKNTVLINTVHATAALLQEATQRKTQLMMENQLILSLLRQVDAPGAEAMSTEVTPLTPQLTELMDFLAQGMLVSELRAEDCPGMPPADAAFVTQVSERLPLDQDLEDSSTGSHSSAGGQAEGGRWILCD